MTAIRITPLPGDTALDITSCAVRLASIFHKPVEFQWHGQTITVGEKAIVEEVVKRLREL